MKKIFLSLLLFAICSLVFAEEAKNNASDNTTYIVRWEWALDDEDVLAFRFNVNDPNPDVWEYVVDSSVLSYSIRDAKKGETYTLYLQQSYDGVYWSDSAISTVVL